MTEIEWTHIPGYTGKSWNPITGCQKIAHGCKNCYAEAVANRFWGERKFTDVQTHADRLDQPLRRRKPTCWFVNSMSDLFHEDVPGEFIAAVYGVMAACPQHLFIILTKRPKRMREFFLWAAKADVVGEGVNAAVTEMFCQPNANDAAHAALGEGACDKLVTDPPHWPLPNVIHGYSASTQADLDAGIADLLATPSALRCLSLEPLIGPVDVGAYLWRTCSECSGRMHVGPDGSACNCAKYSWRPGYERRNELHWVITGGESGPGARPCDVAWIRSIVAQCKAASVPCFVKQVGSRPTGWGGISVELSDRKGADPTEWPDDLRVREWPEVQA